MVIDAAIQLTHSARCARLDAGPNAPHKYTSGYRFYSAAVVLLSCRRGIVFGGQRASDRDARQSNGADDSFRNLGVRAAIH